MREIVTSCTRDCPGGCGLVATVEGGRVVRLAGNPAHPVSRGGICAKTARYPERARSPERVLHPLRRRGKGGCWERVSWTAALDELAERLGEARDEWGPESILHYLGYGERTALKLLNQRFYSHLGGVTTLAGSLCGGTGFAAMGLDFGVRVSHDPLDHLNSRTIILWGRNPVATQAPLARIVREARRRNGARVVLVDPVASESAALADLHLQPRPGSDVFLALAAARLVLESGLADMDFVSRADGFEAFRKLVYRHSLEELAKACDVPAESVTLLAEAMLERPAAVLLGWGMHRWERGHEAVRAIDGLAAVSGNIGLKGGGVSQGFEEYGPFAEEAWGDWMHPPRRKLLMPLIGREILRVQDEQAPPIRVAVVSAANPACMAPDSRSVAEGFGRVGFTAYLGHFMDDTADLADLFLPCATFLEETDMVASYGHNCTGPVNKAVDPPGECRSQFDIYMDLAARFEFADLYVKPIGEWLRRIMRPVLDQGVGFEELMSGPVRLPDAPMVPWSDGKFATPSGRFRFLTTVETPLTPPRTQYPYSLLTVGHPATLCSELTMAEHSPLPEARLNPAKAAALGLADGDEAVLASPRAKLRVVIRHDPSQRRDTVTLPRGGWRKAGHGVNMLTEPLASQVGNGTPYYETRVRVRRG